MSYSYVKEVVGYSGLFAPGPLMATLLLDAFTNKHLAETATSFDFRAKWPLFGGLQIQLDGRVTEACS